MKSLERDLQTFLFVVPENHQQKCHEIIKTLNKHNVNPNAFFNTPNGIALPLIYFATVNKSTKQLFEWIISHKKFNPNLCDAALKRTKQPFNVHILIWADQYYIPTLVVRYKMTMSVEDQRDNLIKLIQKGHIDKVGYFHKHGIIKSFDWVPDTIYLSVLESYFKSLLITESVQNRTAIHKRYYRTFQYLLIKMKCPVFREFSDRLLDTYLIDIIQLFAKHLYWDRKLCHYSCFDQEVRNLLPEIYNEDIFNAIRKIQKKYYNPKLHVKLNT